MARRKHPPSPPRPPAELVPRLKAAVEVLDEALENLAAVREPARAKRPRAKRSPR